MPAIGLGATEKHQGRKTRDTEMVPTITFDKKTNMIRVEFSQPIEWLEIDPEKALGFALNMIKAASRGFEVKKTNHG